MANNEYPILTNEVLQFLIGELYKLIPTLSKVIDSESNDDTVATSKAVYDFVTAAIAGKIHISFKKVTSIDDVTEENTIYLVPNVVSGEKNIYDEYILIDNTPELIGTTEIDLSDYVRHDELHLYTKEEISAMIAAAKGE